MMGTPELMVYGYPLNSKRLNFDFLILFLLYNSFQRNIKFDSKDSYHVTKHRAYGVLRPIGPLKSFFKTLWIDEDPRVLWCMGPVNIQWKVKDQTFNRLTLFLLHNLFQGNVEFDSEDKDTCHVSNTDEQEIISRLLGVTKEDLEKAMCFRVIAARGEAVEKSHTKQQAYYGRDAFAKVTLWPRLIHSWPRAIMRQQGETWPGLW